jgi:type II secretory pathway pseudopilin PulG
MVRATAGFSVTETSVVVAATSLLTATAAPNLQEYLETARATKALGDVRVIAMSLVRLTAHVGHPRRGADRAELLVSQGDIPQADVSAVRPWTRPIDHRIVQSLVDHLVDNAAEYVSRWRGPYMEGLSPDPWGARYAANVGFLIKPGGHAVLVISAGPNGILETPIATVGLRTGGDDIVAVVGRGRD